MATLKGLARQRAVAFRKSRWNSPYGVASWPATSNMAGVFKYGFHLGNGRWDGSGRCDSDDLWPAEQCRTLLGW